MVAMVVVQRGKHSPSNVVCHDLVCERIIRPELQPLCRVDAREPPH